jgi:coenzyme F420-dependent oxidoreductase
MTERDAFLPVGSAWTLEETVAVAEEAEALGYDRIWLPETWGRDAVTTLALVAERTDEVGIGTGIVNVYARSPALLGQTAATLQEASDGRVRLGLGPSGPAVIENWHGVDYGNPLRRTREAVEATKQVLSGDVVDYDGEYVSMAGFRLRQGAPEPVPPVDATGMGPKATELAGRFADGWHALMLTREGLAARLEDFERGVDMGTGSREDRRTTLSLQTAALADGDRARELTRRHVAFYVGAMGDFYREALLDQGWDVAATVHEEWQAGDREAATAAIPEGLLDELVAAGTPDAARSAIAGFEAVDGLDAVAVSPPRGATADEVYETLRAVAPE